MNSAKFYKTLIVILVLINLGTLSYLWWFNAPPPPPGHGPPLSEKLGLEGKNKTIVDGLEKQHHEEKGKLVRKDQSLHEDYFALIGTGKNSEELLNEIQANSFEIEQMTYQFFDTVAHYCTTEQQNQLRTFIFDRLVKLGPPPPPRH